MKDICCCLSLMIVITFQVVNCIAQLKPEIVDKIEEEFLFDQQRVSQSCDLVISKPAWTHLDQKITEDRVVFVWNSELSSLATRIKDVSTCIILIALQAKTKDEREGFEEVIGKKAASTMILLTTTGDIEQNPLHCSLNDWSRARQSFHLDLTKAKVMMFNHLPIWLADTFHCRLACLSVAPPSQDHKNQTCFKWPWSICFLTLPGCLAPLWPGDVAHLWRAEPFRWPTLVGNRLRHRKLKVHLYATWPHLTLSRTKDPTQPTGIDPGLLRIAIAMFQGSLNMSRVPFLTETEPITGRFSTGSVHEVCALYVFMMLLSCWLSFLVKGLGRK